jgi:DNA-binding response OmpR family regulator
LGGYRVLAASDSSAALSLWKHSAAAVALVIVDRSRAGLADVTKLIREDKPDIPILQLINYGESQGHRRISPPSSFLEKPIGIVDLRAKITGLLTDLNATSRTDACDHGIPEIHKAPVPKV